MKSSHSLSRPRGFTLTEIAIVLGIVGLLLGAIWVAAMGVHRQNLVNQAAQELQTVSQNMLTLYQGRKIPAPACAGGSDITANAIAAAMVPSSYVVPAACAQAADSWGKGGSLIITGGTGSTSFAIAFSKVPHDDCIGLLLQATGCDPSQSSCPVSTLIAGTGSTTIAPSGTPLNWSPNMTPTTAALACTSSNANTITFTYNL